jgi:truncated hemoglobin YjbI
MGFVNLAFAKKDAWNKVQVKKIHSVCTIPEKDYDAYLKVFKESMLEVDITETLADEII